MSVRRSAGTIFWGLALVAIGGLLLARNLGYPIPIWTHIARYWPALLIAWGLLKFIDYYRFRKTGDARPLFTGGEVALLIFVIIAGSAITTASNISPDFGDVFRIGDLDLWDITGNNFTFDEHLEQNVPSGSTIQIINLYGSVDVRPSESDRVILDVSKTVRASDKEEAGRLSGDFTFQIKNEGSIYRIVSNRDDAAGAASRPGARQRFKSSLTIQVPRQSALSIDNRNGQVTVQDLTGKQTIVNKYGSVDVRGVTGELNVDNRNGNVNVQDVTESVTINNSYSGTTVKNIGGSIEIRNRNGAVDVSGVKGNAAISNSYASISVDNVEGELTVTGRNNGLDIEHVQGGLKAESSYQNVSISDARGGVSLNSRNGDLYLSFERPPEKDISVSNRYGNVRIVLPSASSFSIDARTEYGEVDSEFENIDRSRSNRDASLRGRNGRGGPRITITTRNGNIELSRRG
ncbi:MAG: DUF4097 family beta strand repeat protein [Acidobacteria bacterium]|nr:DUF4097 family beta strand repeat protein [Acidobacteriota bacterium]